MIFAVAVATKSATTPPGTSETAGGCLSTDLDVLAFGESLSQEFSASTLNESISKDGSGVVLDEADILWIVLSKHLLKNINGNRLRNSTNEERIALTPWACGPNSDNAVANFDFILALKSTLATFLSLKVNKTVTGGDLLATIRGIADAASTDLTETCKTISEVFGSCLVIDVADVDCARFNGSRHVRWPNITAPRWRFFTQHENFDREARIGTVRVCMHLIRTYTLNRELSMMRNSGILHGISFSAVKP